MYQRYQTSTIVSKPLVPAQMTTMPPRSHTKMEVGIVSCPGWSNTMFGLRFSPSTSQMALPKDFAPSNHVFQSGESHAGGTPQCGKALRLLKPTAPSAFAYSPLSGELT